MGKHRRISFLLGPDVQSQSSGHRLGVTSLALLDGVSTLLTAGKDSTVRVWDRKATCQGVLEAHADSVHDIISIPTGILASTAATMTQKSGGGMDCSVTSNQTPGRQNSASLTSLTPAPPAQSGVHFFATASADHTVMVHGATAGSGGVGFQSQVIAESSFHSEVVKKIALHDADSSVPYLYSASLDHCVTSHNIDRGLEVMTNFNCNFPVYSLERIAGSGNGANQNEDRTVLLAGLAQGSVQIVDPRLETPGNLIRSAHQSAVKSILALQPLSPSSLGGSSPTLRPHRDTSSFASGSTSTDHLFVTGSADGAVKVWDLRSTKHFLNLTLHHDAVWTLAQFPGSQTILSAGRDASVVATNLLSMQSASILNTDYPINDLCLGEMNSVLYVATTGNSVHSYSVTSLLSLDTIRAGVDGDSVPVDTTMNSTISPSRIGLAFDDTDHLPQPVDLVSNGTADHRRYTSPALPDPVVHSSKQERLMWASSTIRPHRPCAKMPEHCFKGTAAAIETVMLADRKHALARYDDYTTSLWNVITQTCVHSWPAPPLAPKRGSTAGSSWNPGGTGNSLSGLPAQQQPSLNTASNPFEGTMGVVSVSESETSDNTPHNNMSSPIQTSSPMMVSTGAVEVELGVMSGQGSPKFHSPHLLPEYAHCHLDMSTLASGGPAKLRSLDEMKEKLDTKGRVHARSWYTAETRWGYVVVNVTAEEGFNAHMSGWEYQQPPVIDKEPQPSIQRLSRQLRAMYRQANPMNLGYTALAYLLALNPALRGEVKSVPSDESGGGQGGADLLPASRHGQRRAASSNTPQSADQGTLNPLPQTMGDDSVRTEDDEPDGRDTPSSTLSESLLGSDAGACGGPFAKRYIVVWANPQALTASATPKTANLQGSNSGAPDRCAVRRFDVQGFSQIINLLNSTLNNSVITAPRVKGDKTQQQVLSQEMSNVLQQASRANHQRMPSWVINTMVHACFHGVLTATASSAQAAGAMSAVKNGAIGGTIQFEFVPLDSSLQPLPKTPSIILYAHATIGDAIPQILERLKINYNSTGSKGLPTLKEAMKLHASNNVPLCHLDYPLGAGPTSWADRRASGGAMGASTHSKELASSTHSGKGSSRGSPLVEQPKPDGYDQPVHMDEFVEFLVVVPGSTASPEAAVSSKKDASAAGTGHEAMLYSHNVETVSIKGPGGNKEEFTLMTVDQLFTPYSAQFAFKDKEGANKAANGNLRFFYRKHRGLKV